MNETLLMNWDEHPFTLHSLVSNTPNRNRLFGEKLPKVLFTVALPLNPSMFMQLSNQLFLYCLYC